MRGRRSFARIGLLGLLFVFALAQPGFAYLGQGRVSVIVTAAAAVVQCGSSVNVTAVVLKTRTHTPIRNATVQWEITTSPSASDSLSATSTLTNHQGRTSIRLKLADTEGVRVIKATANGASGYTTITCRDGGPRHRGAPFAWHWGGLLGPGFSSVAPPFSLAFGPLWP